jgi:hypothetical protein
MQEHDQHKHVTLWIAVGVTMAVVVAFWAFGLPQQIQDVQASSAKEPDRWNVLVDRPGRDDSSLTDRIEELGNQLDRIGQQATAESQARNSAETDTAVRQQIDDLSKQLETSGQKDGQETP